MEIDKFIGEWYDAWSSIKTLKEKELVCFKGFPEAYCLTSKGVEVAQKLEKKYSNQTTTTPTNPVSSVNNLPIASQNIMNNTLNFSSTLQHLPKPFNINWPPPEQRPANWAPCPGSISWNLELYNKLWYNLLNPSMLSLPILNGQQPFQFGIAPWPGSFVEIVHVDYSATPKPMVKVLVPLHRRGEILYMFNSASKFGVNDKKLFWRRVRDNTIGISKQEVLKFWELSLLSHQITPAEFHNKFFKLALIVDAKENFNTTESFDNLRQKMLPIGVAVFSHVLQNGDYAFAIVDPSEPCQLLLNVAMERKRLLDLQTTITDYRSELQCSQLKESGSHIIYAIQGSVQLNRRYSKTLEEHQQILENMKSNGFLVKEVKNEESFFDWLVSVGQKLQFIAATEGLPLKEASVLL